MSKYAISWKHEDTYLGRNASPEREIDVFEAQVWGWQLHVADLMLNGGRDHDGNEVAAIPHSAFAALQVGLVYFEAIARYEAGYTGTRKSKEYFKKGLRAVFPSIASSRDAATERLLDELYVGARCGLYHMSMTAPGIALLHTTTSEAISLGKDQILIDPHKMITALKDHFASYVHRLRDSTESNLQRNFKKSFDQARRRRRH